MAAMTLPPRQNADPTAFDAARYRADFPIFRQTMNGHPLVYLDSAATTQKPQAVIDRMTRFYENEYGTVRRGVYALSAKATLSYEAVRQQIADFLHAPSAREIIFTRGTTEAINLVASSFGRKFVGAGDAVLISSIEHHANIVPWQRLCEEKGATLNVIPVLPSGELDLSQLPHLLTPQTKIVAINYVSNALGTVNPVAEIIRQAHTAGIPVLVDGAQSAPHLAVDVQTLDCDFYCFSGHKVYGPSGIGVLYGKAHWLEQMDPYQSGGDMIETVSFSGTTYAPIPQKFEAGTPAIAEVIGLGAALTYLTDIGLDRIAAHEAHLLAIATERLQALPGIRLIGTAAHKASVVSFVFEDVHPHDIGSLLDESGICVRAGHHCAQPVMQFYGVPATTRVSFGLYNTVEDIDRLIEGLQRVLTLFRSE